MPIASRYVAALLCSWLTASPATALQGSAEDYARSAGLPNQQRRRLVTGEPKDLRWGQNGDLEYRVERPGAGSVFVFVDPGAEAGSRIRELELGELPWQARGVASEPQVARAKYVAGERVELLIEGGGLWSWDAAARELEALDPLEAVAWHWRTSKRTPQAPRQSVRATAFWWLNRSDERLTLEWISGDGQPQSYAELEPGESHWQTTYVNHAWHVVNGEGEVLLGFRAGERAGLVVSPSETLIDESQKILLPEPRREARARVVVREHNLWWIDGDVERQLTRDGTSEHPYLGARAWNSERTRALVLREKRPDVRRVTLIDARPSEGLQPVASELEYAKPGDPLREASAYVLQLEPDGESQVLPVDRRWLPSPWSLNRARYIDSAECFTLLYNERGHGVVRWLAIDPESAEVEVWIDEDPDTFVDYTNKLDLRVLEDRGLALWLSERSGWNHLYAVDLANSPGTPLELTALTSGDWVVQSVVALHLDEGWVHVKAMGYHADQDPYHVHHLRVPLDGSPIVALTVGDGTHSLEFSPDGAYYVDSYSRVDLAPITELRRTSDGTLLEPLEIGDTSALEAAGWSPPQRFVAPGRDGTTPIWGIVHRPTNFDPKQSYPVIEQIYAGPHGAHVPKSFRAYRSPMAMAELGFVVVQVDGMGTNWRSKAFHDVCWKNIGDAGLPDRIAWLRALARTDSSLDLDRVGIYGGSAGGQNALRALLVHPEFYKAGVADCGCHDNRMDKVWWNEMWMGYPIGPHYAEQSNVTQAHRLRGDLLLIVGALDRNVDPSSTMQVVDALIEADRDFELLVMPSRGHGAAESPYGKRRRKDFFVRHLMGREPRWEP